MLNGKYKFKKWASVMAAIPALMIGSCTDLSEEVYNTVLTDEYGKTPAEIETIVGRAYASMRGYDGNWTLEFPLFLVEGASDEAVIPTRGTDWFDGGLHQDIQRHQWTVNNVAIEKSWNIYFTGVSKVNSIIYEIDKAELSDEDKNNIKAELRGLRAYYYYVLCDLFGNVPLQTDFSDKELKSNTSRSEIFDFIESELLDVIDYLPASGYGKFTKNVGYSMLARLYLNAEVFKGEAMWQKAIDAADQVTGYSLEGNIFDNFLKENEGSSENIFVIPFDESVTIGNYWQSLYLHYKSGIAFEINAWCGNGMCAEPKVWGLYDEADKRRNGLLEGPLLAPDGTQLLQDDGNPVIHTPEITSLENAKQGDGVRNIKYEIAKGDNWERSNDWVLIRYAEIVMIKAEALMRLGRTSEAQSLVAQVRDRAGLSTPTDIDLDFMYDELLREFVWEGHRRTDQIRFGRFGEAWWAKEVSEPYRTIFPIPANAMAANAKLVQNPGYSN
ncbi:RagB/SusD family nutrient uptake outer membrane protein [Limibacter armeniacum]|uniref:RagB/SusD family nutrient uptake outer membrane protein n=1 Tax=Limibacter armeniacum TaxID=466084 RepID=UPI002FE5E188